MVAAGHEEVAEAAAVVLRAGGNAFDAVVAAGFASAHCEPGFTSLAGGGFLLARTVAGEELLFDFFVDAPGRGLAPGELVPAFEAVTVYFAAAQQVFHCGLGSVAVPGNLAGYLHVHRRLGRLPLPEVVAPAVGLARRGVTVTATQAADFALLAPILQRTAASRAIFAPAGRLLNTGDRLVNPELGAFIERLADDPTVTLYSGETAERLVAQMAGDGDQHGWRDRPRQTASAPGRGLLTSEDLASYRVVERSPLAVGYRGHVVLTNPPPSFGGALIARALRQLDAAGAPAPAGSPQLAVALIGLMDRVDRRREAELRSPPTRPAATRGTTHVSVTDGEGNVAAMTTSNGECSGDVVPGTGVLLNNMLGEDDLHPDGFHAAPPGMRVASMMSPTIVLADDATGCRRPALVLGSGGSKRIRSAILQVLVGVVDHHLDLVDAVDRPRLHWDGDHTEVEPGLGDDVLDALRSVAPVNVWPARSLYFGGVHAVAPGPPALAVGDRRRGGAVRRVPARRPT